MNKQEKIDLLNSMEIEDSSASCGELGYILVEDNDTNRNILHNIGLTGKEINNCADYGCIEISGSACDIGTFWFDGKKFYFFNRGDVYEDDEHLQWEVDFKDGEYILECMNVSGDQPIKNIKYMKLHLTEKSIPQKPIEHDIKEHYSFFCPRCNNPVGLYSIKRKQWTLKYTCCHKCKQYIDWEGIRDGN